MTAVIVAIVRFPLDPPLPADAVRDMAAGLDALGDHVLTSGVDGRARLVDAADLPAGDAVRGHQRRIRPAPEELDHRQLLGGHLERLAVEEQDDEAGTDGTAGECPHLVDLASGRGRLGATDRQHPEAAVVRHLGCQSRGDDARHRRQLDR